MVGVAPSLPTSVILAMSLERCEVENDWQREGEGESRAYDERMRWVSLMLVLSLLLLLLPLYRCLRVMLALLDAITTRAQRYNAMEGFTYAHSSASLAEE